jgi:hypothetical protein
MAPSYSALGFSPHSGWAILVALAGERAGDPARPPTLVLRRRVDLLPTGLPVQPYHVAAESGISIEEGAALIASVERAACDRAAREVQAAIDELQAAGHAPVAAAVISTDANVPSSFERILASHPLLHAAEGRLYTTALDEAVGRHGLVVHHAPRRGLWQYAAAVLGEEQSALEVRAKELGRSLGPPWRKEERETAIAAWLALRASLSGPA